VELVTDANVWNGQGPLQLSVPRIANRVLPDPLSHVLVLNGVRGDVLHYRGSFFVVSPKVKIHAIEAQKCTNCQQCRALISILECVGLRNSNGQ